MRIRYNNLSSLANDAATLNDVMNRFFNNVAYEHSRNGGNDGANDVNQVCNRRRSARQLCPLMYG